MGLFDEYVPDPPLQCPACGKLLEGWQGRDGPCGLMVWRQGVASPIDQPIDDEVRLAPDDLARQRLPEAFTIRTKCCSTRFWVEAECRAVNGVWARSDIVAAESGRLARYR